MEYKKILKHITGISTPLFGLQWTPSVVESDVAREIVVFLEDRRVLYRPDEDEGPSYCRQSVERIREKLTDNLLRFSSSGEINKLLREFRTQCRKFCDEIGSPKFPKLARPVQRSILKRELEKLRLVAGKVIGALSISYGIDVEDELAAIIPFKSYPEE
jgi:hypothetical protein